MKNHIWNAFKQVRQRSPLVLNLTNFVTMNNSANTLLALGASPLMTQSIDELEDLINISNITIVNIGTLDKKYRKRAIEAAKISNEKSKPWILDPVGMGASKLRNDLCYELLKYNPSIIKGNASEIIALANAAEIKSKGVDSTNSSDEALDSAKFLAKKYNCVVGVTGEKDYIVSTNKIAIGSNGHPMMTAVTALGCSCSATVGAFVLDKESLFESVVAGISIFSLCGQLAAEQSKGPGSLQLYLYDQLYSLSEEEFNNTLALEIHEY